MSDARLPAEVFSVGQFLKEELDARGWSLDDLLNRMPGDRMLNHLWIDLTMSAHEFDPEIRRHCRLGDPSALAHALGVSKEFLSKMDATWVAYQNRTTPPADKQGEER